MSQQPWYILGAGALGLLYATRLDRSGTSVKLLTRPERAAELSLGVTLKEGQEGPQKRHFLQLLKRPETCPPIQRLLVATKSGQAAAALKTWQEALTPDAQILLLQNGLGSQAEVAAQLAPTQTLLAASVTEGAYLENPATVVHAGQGKTRLGRWSGPETQAALAWAARLTAAGLSAEQAEPIRPVLWQKLAINAVINPLTAVHRVENGALAGREFKPEVDALIQEVLAVFKRLGIAEPEGSLAYRIEQVILATASNRSSMLQDVLAGKPTEIDYITGALLKAARPFNLELKTSRRLYARIKANQVEGHPKPPPQ